MVLVYCPCYWMKLNTVIMPLNHLNNGMHDNECIIWFSSIGGILYYTAPLISYIAILHLLFLKLLILLQWTVNMLINLRLLFPLVSFVGSNKARDGVRLTFRLGGPWGAMWVIQGSNTDLKSQPCDTLLINMLGRGTL